jgi:hypothetical protein
LRALESEELAVQLAELAAAGVASLATSDGDRWSFYATQAEDELPAPLQELRLSTATTRAATKALARLRPEGLSRPLRRSTDEREELEPALARVLAELIAAPEPALLRLLAARLPQLPPEEVRSALARAELSLRFRPADDKERGAAPAGSAAALAAALAAAGLPAPLALEKRFRGVLLLASLEADGRIRFRGRRYASAAAAAEAARAAVGSTAAGELARSDGLRFWAYREPQSGVLRPLAELGNDSES